MFSIPTNNTKRKRRLKKSLAPVCVVCVIVSVLSASLVIAFAGHEHEALVGCTRTNNPLHICENDPARAQPQARANTQTGMQSQTQNEAKSGCLACVLIQKVVNPLRQTGFAVSSATLADIGMFALLALCIFSLVSAAPSPVELKTKITN
jgi:hypothetical protein